MVPHPEYIMNVAGGFNAESSHAGPVFFPDRPSQSGIWAGNRLPQRAKDRKPGNAKAGNSRQESKRGIPQHRDDRQRSDALREGIMKLTLRRAPQLLRRARQGENKIGDWEFCHPMVHNGRNELDFRGPVKSHRKPRSFVNTHSPD